jgi:D-methionine transport system substrate-binding protein
MLPRLMHSNQLDMAIINANFAMLSGLSPNKDAIFLESIKNNQYINIIAIRKSDASNINLIALKKVITGNDVKNFIQNKYKGAVIPAF